MPEDLLRRAVFVDDALVHKENTGAHIPRNAHFVGNDEHGHSLLRQTAYYTEDLPYHRGVEGRCRFVKEYDFRVHGKRTRNGNPLLLTAGKGGRVNVGLLGHAHFSEQFHGLLYSVFPGELQKFHGGIDDILQHGLVLKEIETLEHHAHLHPEFVERILACRNILPVHDDLTRGGRLEHVKSSQKSTFPGTGRADDAYDFSLFYLTAYVFKGADGTSVRIDEGFA